MDQSSRRNMRDDTRMKGPPRERYGIGQRMSAPLLLNGRHLAESYVSNWSVALVAVAIADDRSGAGRRHSRTDRIGV
jgi:hypothetical protein